NMIDSILLRQKAEEENIFISAEEVENYLQLQFEQFKSNFVSDEDYLNYLQEMGMNEYELKKEIKKQIEGDLLIKKYLSMKVLPEINIGEADIRDFYKENKEQLIEPVKVSINGVFIYKLPSESKIEETISRMEAIRKRAMSGEDFGELAKKYSEFPDAKNGGFIDFFPRGTYLTEFEDVAFALEVGEISEPFYTPYGIELVKLEARKANEISVRHIVLKLKLTEQDLHCLSKNIEYIRTQLEQDKTPQEIIESAPYEQFKMEAVVLDEANLMEIEQIYPTVSAEIENMKEGDVSLPIELTDGYFILRVQEKSGGKQLSLDEARDIIKSELTNMRVDEKRRKLVDNLKEKAYIRIMLEEVG
ncbi:MAG TPA: hypothetical protein ENI43_03380, partial [Firmicutes bacterium]|nr:hypothetical protein [Bacillota bacterium]